MYSIRQLGGLASLYEHLIALGTTWWLALGGADGGLIGELTSTRPAIVPGLRYLGWRHIWHGLLKVLAISM